MDAILPGFRCWYEMHGPPDGRPVLLIAGNGSSADVWPAAFIDALAAGGSRVIRYDQRDTGRSERTPLELEYDLWDQAADAADLLRHLGLTPAAIVGYSMGAAVAQCLAVRHPDLVESLTLLSGLARPDRGFVLGDRAIATMTNDWDNAQLAEEFMLATLGRHDDEDLRRARFELAGRPPVISAYSVDRHTAAALRTIPPSDEELGAVGCEVLVIAGSDDDMVPRANAEAVASDFSRGRLVVIDGMGHWPAHRYASALARLVGDHVTAPGVRAADFTEAHHG